MESNPSCTISYHDLEVFESDSNKLLYMFSDKNPPKNGKIQTSIKWGTFNGACSTMTRKDKCPKLGFYKNIPVASDWLFWIETLSNGGTINYINKSLGRYRRHSNNITAHSLELSQNELDHLNTCNIILQRWPQFFSESMYCYSQRLIQSRHKLPYLKCLIKSFLISPTIKAATAGIVYIVSFRKIKL